MAYHHIKDDPELMKVLIFSGAARVFPSEFSQSIFSQIKGEFLVGLLH